MILFIIKYFITLVSSILTGIIFKFGSHDFPNATAFTDFITVVKSNEIAHRGGAYNAPENTMCAFRRAVQLGHKTLEIDIQFTADNIPVGKFSNKRRER